MDCLRISAIFCSLTGFVMLLTALSTDYWVREDFHMGLWKICRQDEECDSLGMDVEGYIHATRAFVLMAIILGSVCVVGLCFSYFRPCVGSVFQGRMVLIASFIAGLCAILAPLIFRGGYYGAFNSMLELQRPWSFFLCNASTLLFAISAILAWKVRIRTLR